MVINKSNPQVQLGSIVTRAASDGARDPKYISSSSRVLNAAIPAHNNVKQVLGTSVVDVQQVTNQVTTVSGQINLASLAVQKAFDKATQGGIGSKIDIPAFDINGNGVHDEDDLASFTRVKEAFDVVSKTLSDFPALGGALPTLLNENAANAEISGLTSQVRALAEYKLNITTNKNQYRSLSSAINTLNLAENRFTSATLPEPEPHAISLPLGTISQPTLGQPIVQLPGVTATILKK
jgi:hypothetical protein